MLERINVGKYIRRGIIVLGLILSGLPSFAQVGLFIRPNSSSLSAPVQGQTWLFNSTNNTMQVYNGSIFATASAPQNNFAATIAPTSVNDNTEGYSLNSAWYNTSNGYLYTCVDATTSAAIWVQINNLGSLSIPLTSIQQGGATTGQALIWNGTQWNPSTQNISLNNILQTGATVGQVPVWNGSTWVPSNSGTVSGNINTSQITQSGASNGDALQWNGTNWVAVNPTSLVNVSTSNQIVTAETGNLSGAWGWVTGNSQTYSGTQTIQNDDPTFIYIDAGSSAANITLPPCNQVLGKVYTLIIINFSNNVTFNTDSGGPDQLYLYGNPTPVTTLTFTSGVTTNYPFIITSDGAGPPGNWYQLTAPAP